MKNWKTTLAGTCFAGGQALMNLGGDKHLWWLGLVLTVLGGGGIGAVAKDHDQVGKP